MADNRGINARAQTGFAKANAYDQHRPTYPSKSTQTLLEQTRVAWRKGAKLLDLAAGTGKFTTILAARDEDYEIIAVEPHDGMRDVLDGKKLSRVTVVPGKADSIPLKDESVDAVLVAQVGQRLVSHFTSSPSSFTKYLELSSTTSLHLVVGVSLVRNYEQPKGDPPCVEASRGDRHDMEHRRLQRAARSQGYHNMGGQSPRLDLDV